MDTLLTLDKAAIDSLSDGIVLLDPKGAITSINRAGQVSLKRCIDNRQLIFDCVTAANNGSMKLPASVEFPDAAGITARLCDNGRRGFVLVIQHDPEGQKRADMDGVDPLPLMGAALQDELRSTAELLKRFVPTGPEAFGVRKQAHHLERLLREVAALAELRVRDKVFSEDRFLLSGTVRDLLPLLPRQSGADAIQYIVDDGRSEQGTLYGNRRWMEQALHTLLLRLASGCPPVGLVRIELSQIGDFVILAARAGARGTAALPMSRPRSATNATFPEHGLAMEICRRIIELHGGQMKLTMLAEETGEALPSDGPIESVTISFPTGLPVADRSRVSCAECRITYQAMQYARDLADMMAQGSCSVETPLARKAS